MEITNKTIKDISADNNLSLKFNSVTHNDLNIKCNILSHNFYLDTFNYFPITEEFYSFKEIFSWGDGIKYEIFYSNNFLNNFKKNIDKFKSFSNIYLLGSHYNNNYYRNMINFIPRLFFTREKKIKLGIHRNCSNKIRNIIKFLCKNMNIDAQFIYLDDGFYKFCDSQIPQFLNTETTIKILNTLRINNKIKKREKIYITRKNCIYRQLINESDVYDKLKKSGFRIVDLDDLQIIEQIKLFSDATHIISPTGSGLTNTVFCNPGTKVIEIVPKYNFEYEKHLKFRYKLIAENLKLEYLSVEADPVNIEKINKKIDSTISAKVIKESNYYKNLLLQLGKIEEILAF